MSYLEMYQINIKDMNLIVGYSRYFNMSDIYTII